MSNISRLLTTAAAAGGGTVEAVGVDFDGTNDYLLRSSDLVGNADGKTFTFSCWVYWTNESSSTVFTTTNAFHVLLDTGGNNEAHVTANNSSGTKIFDVKLVDGSSHAIPKNTWSNLLLSIDLANTSNRSVYINDVLFSSVWVTYTNDNIDFTSTKHAVGGYINTVNGSVQANLQGRLAGVYLDYTYRNLSVENNRRLFIDADGLYVKPPTSGILSVPMDDPADPGRNDGTGGDFTLNGIVARSGRGPNQYNAAASTFDGAADYLYRGTLGAADGKKITISAFFRFGVVGNGEAVLFFYNSGATSDYIKISMAAAGFLDIRGNSAANGRSFRVGAAFAPVTNAGVGLYINVSANVETGDIHVYVNGKEASSMFSQVQTDNVNIPFSLLNENRIARSDSANWFQGQIGEVYLTNEYIDLSVDNPFWDADTDKPKYLGESGELPTGSSPLVYLPLRADDAGNNLGTSGDFTVNSGPYAGARGGSEYWARSVKWSGSGGAANNLQRTISTPDTKTATVVMALKSSGSRVYPYSGSNSSKLFSFDTSNSSTTDSSYLQFTNSVAAAIVKGTMPSIEATAGIWNVFLFSVDTSSTSKRHFYKAGESLSVTWNTYSANALIEHAGLTVLGASSTAGSSLADSPLAFFYYSTEYIDFSQESNRLKFVDGLGYPVDLQPAIDAGDIPTPLIYMKFESTTSLGTNSGSGGDFTVNGAVTSGSDVEG